MKTIAIIQARMSSKRLPGKVMMPIMGKPMLLHQIERLQKCKNIDRIVVATSTELEDAKIVDMCIENNIAYYIGKLNDVVDRFKQCADCFQADIILRFTGDCPLVHSLYVDIMIKKFKELGVDYMSNGKGELWNTPDGLDCEIMTKSTLDRIWCNSTIYEHVTKYLWENKELFSYYMYELEETYYKMKLSVDTQEDFDRVKNIFETMGELHVE